MTEINADLQDQDKNIAANEEVNGAGSTEKMIPQTKVNEMIGGAKKSEYERGKRDADTLHAMNLNAQHNQIPQETVNNQGNETGNINDAVTEADVQRIVQQQAEAQQQAIQDQLNKDNAFKVAKEFVDKIRLSEKEHPGLENKVNSMGLQNTPEIIHLANMHDNTGAIMSELESNPSKFASIAMLSRSNPNMAVKAMSVLSDSIKQNTAGLNNKTAPEPLSQLTHSNTASESDGKLTGDEDFLRY